MPLDNDYSMNVADICPVGALTTKDFRFKIRVWFLDDVPGVCTGCANGCNIHLGVANNKVYRYVPRRNDAVNDTWICDEGRMSYKQIGALDRMPRALVRGELGVPEACDFRAAIAAAAQRIARLRAAKGAGAIAGIASPHATNEDLFVFRRFLEALGAGAAGVAVTRGRADDKLIKPEKAANGAGARALGFEDAASLCERIRAGDVAGLIVLGHDLLGADYLGGVEPLAKLDTLIVLDTHASDLQRVAHVLFPTRVAAEKHGTLTNHAGRVQRVRAGRGAAVRRALRGRGARGARRGARARRVRRPLRRPRGVEGARAERARVRERLARRGGTRRRTARGRSLLVIVEVLIKSLFILLVVVAAIAPVITWIERKQSAVMQDRIGANRADIAGITVLGLLHPLADVIKLLTQGRRRAGGREPDHAPGRADHRRRASRGRVRGDPVRRRLHVRRRTRSRSWPPTPTGACSTSSRSARSPPTAR